MDRRRFLATVTGGIAASLGGCARTTGVVEPIPTPPTARGARHDSEESDLPGERGSPPDICEQQIRDDPGIYAITDPAFGRDWSEVKVAGRYVPGLLNRGGGLRAVQTVIGIAGEGLARAYPVSVLSHHEVVNDDVGAAAGEAADGPVIVTYCPLCRSGLVADRVVDGTATTFAVTGHLWEPPGLPVGTGENDAGAFGVWETGGQRGTARRNGNLVMYDEATRSFWSQLIARAICGPKAGTTLEIVPSTVTTWSEWRRDNPDTEVLLPPPHSTTTRTA